MADLEAHPTEPHVRVVVSVLATPEHAEEFLRASAAFERWLRGRDGFLRYELIGSGRHWSDRMEWISAEAADAADAAFAASEFPTWFEAVVDRYLAVAGHAVDLSAVP